jgi:hypothetical protein
VMSVAGPVAAGLFVKPALLTEPAAEEIALRRAEQERPRTAIAFTPEKFDRYVGYYQMSPKMIMTVYRKDDHLLARMLGGMSVELNAESESKFFLKVVPAQVSFVTDRYGRVAEVVLHQYGEERHGRRVDVGEVPINEDDMALRRAAASSDTEISLRRYIQSLEKGEPNYAEMVPEQAVAVRAQLPALKEKRAKWGDLRSVAFQGVTVLGADIYDVGFENARVEWFVAPLTMDGKVRMRSYREMGAPDAAQRSNVQ